MKKKYVSPELRLLLLHLADIITASFGTGTGGGTFEGEEDEFDVDVPAPQTLNEDWK